MIRFLASLLVFICFYIVGMLVAPILPLFASMRDGPADNSNGTGIEPRLPLWLFWFDTSYDNSLWGDKGWRNKHAPNIWGTWRGMVCWLWRNCACGFSWTVLAWAVTADETFTVTGDLTLDKNQNRDGSFSIKSSRGAFQYRWVKMFGRVNVSFEAGWLLDIYVKDDAAKQKHPRAIFMCSPQIKFNRP